ncbi:MAG: PAS domain S-box protein, partial [Muribaculaceae bacterium]|nr:PAS domain S-box protein [Muribaculaceae bacterium]
MKINVYFWLIVLVTMSMSVAIVGLGLQSEGWLFYFAECCGVLVLILLFVLYRKVVRPIRTISGGMDLLVQQDFASRLVPVGQREADRIVCMFNQMMDCLKQQRLLVREQNQFLDLLINASPMAILTFDSKGRMTAVNAAGVTVFDGHAREDFEGKMLSELSHPLAMAVAGMAKGEIRTVRMSDSRIYKCSMLSYMDSGWAHPFMLIESLTDEVMAAEKRAYGKVIRMIAHEVNNTMCGVGSMLVTVSSAMTENQRDMA